MSKNKSILQTNIFWLILVGVNLICGFLSSFVDSTIGSLLIAQASILVPTILYLIVTKKNPIKTLRLKKIGFGTIALVVVVAGCIMPIVSLINAISMLVFSNLTASTMTDITEGGLLFSLAVMALLPTITEETAFRGVMLSGYKDGKRPLQAILFSALAFGLMHMNFNQMCYAVFMGIVMGILVELTGSLFSSMIVHFCINGFSTTLTWALPKLMDFYNQYAPEGTNPMTMDLGAAQYTNQQLMMTILLYTPIAIVASILVVLLFWAIAKLNHSMDIVKFWFSKECKEERNAIPRERVFDVFYGVTFAFCLGMCIFVEVMQRMS